MMGICNKLICGLLKIKIDNRSRVVSSSLVRYTKNVYSVMKWQVGLGREGVVYLEIWGGGTWVPKERGYSFIRVKLGLGRKKPHPNI